MHTITADKQQKAVVSAFATIGDYLPRMSSSSAKD